VRPLLAIGLIVVGVGALVGIFVLAKKMGGADPEPEAEAEAPA